MAGFHLLPWREARRRERRRQFTSLLALTALLALAVVLAVFVFNQRQLARQRERQQLLAAEIAVLDARIGEIRSLRERIAALTARRDAVERLQQARATPVRLLDELVGLIPQGVMLKSLQQSGRISLSGYAQSGARVSELLRALAGLTAASHPELAEIKSATVGQGRDAKRVFEFSIAMEPMAVATVQAQAAPKEGR